MNKIKLVVVDENALGYIDPRTPNTVSILNSNYKSSLNNYGNYNTQGCDIRLASEQDFDRLKVVFDGYKNDSDYEYKK